MSSYINDDLAAAFRAMARQKLIEMDPSPPLAQDDFLGICIDICEALIDELELALQHVARIARDGASFNAGQDKWARDISASLCDLRSNIIEYSRDALEDYDAENEALLADADRRVDMLREENR